MGSGEPSVLERVFVHEPYSRFAPHISQAEARHKPWPAVAHFLSQLPRSSVVADIGCGNGKYCSVSKNLYLIGCDVCIELLEIAKTKSSKLEVCAANTLNLPFRDDVFDAVICIGLLHHIVTQERRTQVLRELARIMKPGATMMVFVWALEQRQRQFAAQDILVPWHIQLQCTYEAEMNSLCAANNAEEPCKATKQPLQGSVSLDPYKSSDPPEEMCVQEESNPAENGWLAPIGRGLEKLRGWSPRFARKQPAKKLAQDSRHLSVDAVSYPPHSLWSKDVVVSGLAKYSPMLGRKLATILRTPSPETLSVEHFAEQETGRIIAEAIGDFLKIVSVTCSELETTGKVEISDDATKLKEINGKSASLYRYYHVFKEGELDDLVSQVPILKIVHSEYDHANWCIVVEKQ